MNSHHLKFVWNNTYDSMEGFFVCLACPFFLHVRFLHIFFRNLFLNVSTTAKKTADSYQLLGLTLTDQNHKTSFFWRTCFESHHLVFPLFVHSIVRSNANPNFCTLHSETMPYVIDFGEILLNSTGWYEQWIPMLMTSNAKCKLNLMEEKC